MARQLPCDLPLPGVGFPGPGASGILQQWWGRDPAACGSQAGSDRKTLPCPEASPAAARQTLSRAAPSQQTWWKVLPTGPCWEWHCHVRLAQKSTTHLLARRRDGRNVHRPFWLEKGKAPREAPLPQRGTLQPAAASSLSSFERRGAPAHLSMGAYLDGEPRGHGIQVLLQRQLQVLIYLVWGERGQ